MGVNMEENRKPMLSTVEAAEFMDISVGYLRKLTMQKKIPYYKPFGNKCYFDKDELLAVLRTNRVATAEETERTAQKYAIRNHI